MRNSTGYTLVEVMIVVGILVTSLFLWAEVQNLTDKSMKYPESQVVVGGLSTAIRETLRYQSTCQTSLAGNALTRTQLLSGNPTEIRLSLPGILHGTDDTDPTNDVLQATSKVQNVEVTNLRLVNTVELPPANSNKFFSEVEIAAKIQNGIALRPIIAGGVFFGTLPAGGFDTCNASTENPVPLCEEMGCKWDPTTTPSCTCQPIDLSCPPQQFITGVDGNGKAICTPLGNGPCPAGYYLRGVSIGQNDCAPLVPLSVVTSVTCPAGTSQTGLGAATGTGCFCNNVGGVWNGTSCTSTTSSCVYQFYYSKNDDSVRKQNYQIVEELLMNAAVPNAHACTPTSACDIVRDSGMIGEPCSVNGQVVGGSVRESMCGPNFGKLCSARCVCTSVTPVNGQCGSADGTTVAVRPTSGYCTRGLVTPVSGTGPWTWRCMGTNGGTNSPQCIANYQSTSPTAGTCGSANGTSRNTPPSGAALCSTGTASSVLTGANYTWSCSGTNCSATNTNPVSCYCGGIGTGVPGMGCDQLYSCFSTLAECQNEQLSASCPSFNRPACGAKYDATQCD